MIPGVPTMGGAELLIILAIILLFFGARRVPELARSLGKAKHEVNKGIEEAEEEERKKVEAQQDNEAASAAEGTHTEDGRIPEEEKPKAGPSSNA
jgi:sec-independent protein translocase protein TatA